MKSNGKHHVPAPPLVRCAIYTRKSTEEGLEQDYNTLDAQRDAGENYVKSLAGEGWTVLPDRFDDGGFTGGNIDRPALRRLIANIEFGKIDVVVVYKVDRLSRSLLDFAQLMSTFEKHKVSFVSVTQQFNTATSMGRLVLNVLLSFAQFEREIISERIRDKIAATRRKGKWTGGWPILGYDVEPQGFKLAVNPVEADRVRTIFQLYLELGSLLPVAEELGRRGWVNKRWKTRKSGERGGKPFTRTSLYKLLTNVAYLGKVRYKDEVHNGEHAAIVDQTVWQQVQAALSRNGRTGGAEVRNKFGALLRGILRCVPCSAAMVPTHTTRGVKRYRYYVCTTAQKLGWHTCPSKAIPAGQIEDLIVQQIRQLGRDPQLFREVLNEARCRDADRVTELEAEQRGLERDLQAWHAEMRALAVKIQPHEGNGPLMARLAELQDRVCTVEARLLTIQEQIHAAEHLRLDEGDARRALSGFEPIWDVLSLKEQTRVLQLLVEQVAFDGSKGKVAITFRPTGIQALARELEGQPT